MLWGVFFALPRCLCLLLLCLFARRGCLWLLFVALLRLWSASLAASKAKRAARSPDVLRSGAFVLFCCAFVGGAVALLGCDVALSFGAFGLLCWSVRCVFYRFCCGSFVCGVLARSSQFSRWVGPPRLLGGAVGCWVVEMGGRCGGLSVVPPKLPAGVFVALLGAFVLLFGALIERVCVAAVLCSAFVALCCVVVALVGAFVLLSCAFVLLFCGFVLLSRALVFDGMWVHMRGNNRFK
jgi:hypothetical protein